MAVGATALSGCRAPRGPVAPTTSPTPSSVAASAANPFGVPAGARVELWADDQWPSDWLDDVAAAAERGTLPLDVAANSSSELAGQLLPRFTGQARPPELVLSTGPDRLGIAELTAQLSDLDPLLRARVDGRRLASALRPGCALTDARGVVRGVATTWQVHGLWYSTRLFDQLGIQPPGTCDELLTLGAVARSRGKYLFTWGRDTAVWFLRLAISTATRQAGDGLLRQLDAMDPAGWEQESLQAALRCLRTCVQEGFVKPGGSALSWEQSRSAWSEQGEVLLAPAGAGMLARANLSTGFAVGLVPDPSLDHAAAMPGTALHAGPAAPLLLPRRSVDPAAGRELARRMLSRAWATRFSATNQVVSAVSDAVPSSRPRGLQLQLDALHRAGSDTYHWSFTDWYGTNHDHQALWNSFLEGEMDVATLTAESQRTSSLVAADPAQTGFQA